MDLSNKKVLVTGADGFIGSHLSQKLLKECGSVRAFTYYNSFNSWGWLDRIPKSELDEIDVFTGDIRDGNGVREATKGCDVILHLAALIAIPFSYHSPESYIDTNVKGTLNVLQAAQSCNVQKIVCTSTSEVYGTARYAPIDESHPLQGQSPYSATKIAADKVAESFHKSFDLPICIARPFNTYGPRQSARAVIPTLITQLLAGHQAIKLGSTKPTRDFNFVEDTVSGLISIVTSDNVIGEEINIATGEEHSIGNLAKFLIEKINPLACIVEEEQRFRPDSSEVYRLIGDNQKIRKLTSWQPKITLQEGLKKTIDWFSDPINTASYKTEIYNM